MGNPIFSSFDHPHFASLFANERVGELFSVAAEVSAMLDFERALAEAQAEVGLVPVALSQAIAGAVEQKVPDDGLLSEGLGRDGVVVPALVGWLREAVGPELADHVHLGATSQDAIDSGLMVRIAQVLELLRQEMQSIVSALDALKSRWGDTEIMGRTRMQRAVAMAFADRITVWSRPFELYLARLDDLKKRVCAAQLGGAVGTLDRLGEHGPNVRALLAEKLGLSDPGEAWHSERDRIADLAHWLAQVSGSCGKLGQDVVLMAQNEVNEVSLGDGGRSSVMPHKRNPIQAEVLVTLARFNAGQNGLIQQTMVHEGERSGAAWTLEWLVLPQMVAATTASLKLGATCLAGLSVTSKG